MRATIFVLTVIVILVAGLPARSQTIIPHEANYALSLLQSADATVTAVDGFYLVRIDGTCETHRITTFLELTVSNTAQGQIGIQDSYSVTERHDGSRLIFKTRQSVNGALVQRLEGTGTKSAADGGKVAFVSPSGHPGLDLPVGTLFPYEAIEGTMRGQLQGAQSVQQLMFDPSIGDVVLVADLFVGTPDPLAEEPSGAVELLTGSATRAVTTFYARDATDAEPISTAIVDIFPNGVSQRAVFDMGQFSVLATLTDIRALSAPDCS